MRTFFFFSPTVSKYSNIYTGKEMTNNSSEQNTVVVYLPQRLNHRLSSRYELRELAKLRVGDFRPRKGAYSKVSGDGGCGMRTCEVEQNHGFLPRRPRQNARSAFRLITDRPPMHYVMSPLLVYPPTPAATPEKITDDVGTVCRRYL